MPRHYKNPADSFCYICGSRTLKEYKRRLTSHVKKLYELYFACKVGDQDKQDRDYQWLICSDLKVVAILNGLQSGYTKFMCFLCKWDSREKCKHYTRSIWSPRVNSELGFHNVIHKPLVQQDKIILPPLHIKLGIMKQFVKALQHQKLAFQYLKNKFPKISDAKIKEGLFVGPQIRELMQDPDFDATMDDHEIAAWNAFKGVCRGLLG